MIRRKLAALVLFALLLCIPQVLSQDSMGLIEPADAEMVNPQAHISFPPPVYVVRDRVDIRGTVTLAEMRNYFIEIRPLVIDPMETAEAEAARQWFPVTPPRIEGTEDDVLGVWNTVTLRDGLYELRLRVTLSDGTPQYSRVSPIRVEKTPPPFMQDTMAEASDMQEDMDTGMDDEMETETETEPAVTDMRPRAIATVNSNVRSGDSTFYPVIGGLREGDSALIKGISSRNTGWYYIELASGRSGFIFPGIVNTEGDLSNLPRINPPPVPPTPIPLPTAVPVQQQPTGANLVMEGVVINPHPGRCGEAYRIDVTVRNNGSVATTSGGLIEVRDTRHDGLGVSATQIGFGPLNPGQAQTVYGHLTQTQYFEELHHINLYLDITNQVAESNEGDNQHASAPYILAKHTCG